MYNECIQSHVYTVLWVLSLPTLNPFPRIGKCLGEHERADILPAALFEPDGTQGPRAHGCSRHSSNNHKPQGASVSAIHQDLQGGDIVDDNGPANGGGGRRQIVLPHYQKDREEFSARADYQGGREGGGFGVVWQAGDPAKPCEGRRGAEEPYRDMEGESTEQTVDEEEEVLQQQRVRAQRTRRRIVCTWVAGLLDARPRQVDVEEQQESPEADDGRL
jgi:hypothetical protein